MLSHLGVLAGGFIVPLIIRLTEGNKNEFVRHHATEALNFQITFMIAWLTGFVLFAVAAVSSGGHRGLPVAVVVVWLVMVVLYFVNLGLSILGCIRASQEKWWRYAVSIRLVRGARPRVDAG